MGSSTVEEAETLGGQGADRRTRRVRNVGEILTSVVCSGGETVRRKMETRNTAFPRTTWQCCVFRRAIGATIALVLL